MDSSVPQAHRCSKCGNEYPLTFEFFYRSKTRPSGFAHYCRVCQKVSNDSWRERNRDHVNQKSRTDNKRRRIEQPEVMRARDRLANKRRSEQHRIDANNQRAKMRKSRGKMLVRDINLMYDSQKGLCWWCDKPLNGNFEIDHRIPISRGGSNEIENLCAACISCNRQKRNKLPFEFNGRLL